MNFGLKPISTHQPKTKAVPLHRHAHAAACDHAHAHSHPHAAGVWPRRGGPVVASTVVLVGIGSAGAAGARDSAVCRGRGSFWDFSVGLLAR